MKENNYKDLHDGIEDLMNTFGGYSKDKKDADDAHDDARIDDVMKASQADGDDESDGVNADDFLSVDADASEADSEIAVDELEVTAADEKTDDSSEEFEKLLKTEAPKREALHKKDKSSSGKKKNGKKKNASPKKGTLSAESGKDNKAKKNVAKKETEHKTNRVSDGEEKTASPRRLVITLAAICAAVALLLAAVNIFTKSQIEENNRKATLESIRQIFDNTVQVEEIAVPEDSFLSSAYLVMKSGGVCGYSATVSPTGFGGPIELMVGISSEGKVVGVDVVSMSETPGLGSKTGSSDFLSQFVGAVGEVKVDAISGATISSNAVAEGVNTVTANLLDIAAMAAERNMSIIPFTPETGTVKTEEKTETVGTTAAEAVVPTPPATEEPAVPDAPAGAPDVSKNDTPPDVIVPNPGNENPGINAEYALDTTEFETLTTEPESTEPSTEESETE